MQWLPTWTGLVGGWVIFLLFFNGSAAYFRQEITTWMKPEVAATVDAKRSVLGAVGFLKVKAPHAERRMISVPDQRHPVSDVSWRPRPVPGEPEEDDDDDEPPPLNQRATVDSDGRLLITRDMHYLPVFLGSLVVGVAGLCFDSRTDDRADPPPRALQEPIQVPFDTGCALLARRTHDTRRRGAAFSRDD